MKYKFMTAPVEPVEHTVEVTLEVEAGCAYLLVDDEVVCYLNRYGQLELDLISERKSGLDTEEVNGETFIKVVR